MSDDKQFWVNINLGLHQLRRARGDILTEDPTGDELVEARLWYNSVTKQFKYYDGVTVVVLGAALAPPTTTIRMSPEYANGVLSALGDVAISGIMDVDFDGEERACFYRWTTPEAITQSFSVVITGHLPGFPIEWESFAVKFKMAGTASFTLSVYDAGGNLVITRPVGAGDEVVAGAWFTLSLDATELAQMNDVLTVWEGEKFTITIRMSASSGGQAFLSDIAYTFNRKGAV